MRTYGRIYDERGTPTWVEVDTDANGYNDLVYLVTLAQVLYGEPGESPFFANYGIPARESVLTQVYPDYYVARTAQQFSQFFAALVVSRVPNTPRTLKAPNVPTYNVSVVTNSGAVLPAVTIPTSIPV